jgi:flagellar biosynthesis/type III secretory pathway M-ring protein FliF/YscJ
MWNALGSGARLGLLIGALVIAGAAIGVAIWSMQPTYRVLFSNLSEVDAGAIVTELKRTKTDSPMVARRFACPRIVFTKRVWR